MKENPNYVRKRKHINFTIADITEDTNENVDEDYKIANVGTSTSRSVPKRNCKKKVVYNENENESDADVYKINEETKH